MARFFTIASGSSGNSCYLGGSDAGVLIDVGVSCKAILSGMETMGVSPSQVRAIFITHEHIDHIRGLRVLLKRLHVPVYASAPVLEFLIENGHVPQGAHLEAVEGRMAVAGMEVTAFRTPHDSVHSLGYRFHTADDRIVAIATDLGYVSEEVRDGIAGCDLVLLESNYEPSMLMNGPYPYPLKKRIAGRTGHLSNEECAGLLPSLVQTGTTRIVLGHLSKENNVPELAYQTSLGGLLSASMQSGRDFLLNVARRSTPGELMVL